MVNSCVKNYFQTYIKTIIGTSVCNGDSGGSILFEKDGVYRIRGIVSLTIARDASGSCNSKEYVIFTDVAKYLLWIEEVTPGLTSELTLKIGNHQTYSHVN